MAAPTLYAGNPVRLIAWDNTANAWVDVYSPGSSNGLNFGLINQVAGERNIGATQLAGYLAVMNDWNITDFNPHTATTGTTITAGTAGNTEVLISAAPVSLGYIITAADTVAGSILLRNTNATGNSVSPIVLGSLLNTTTVYTFGGAKFTTGLTIIGTLAGVSCSVYWKAT